MILYLVGSSCVGKTTIGKMMAEKIGFSFYDLDLEVQKFYKKPIERIQDECFSMISFREKASVVLDFLFSKDNDCVIAGTPSGLKYAYLQVYKKHKSNKDIYSILINDKPENILERLTFFDKDSNPLTQELDERKKRLYLREIKADNNFFKGSYERADFKFDIANVRLDDIPTMIINELKKTINIVVSE